MYVMDDAIPLTSVAVFSHFSEIEYIHLRKVRLIPFSTCVRDVNLVLWNSNKPETYLRSTPPVRTLTHVGVLYFSFFLHRVLASAADEGGDPNENITLACKSYACPVAIIGPRRQRVHEVERENAFNSTWFASSLMVFI